MGSLSRDVAVGIRTRGDIFADLPAPGAPGFRRGKRRAGRWFGLVCAAAFLPAGPAAAQTMTAPPMGPWDAWGFIQHELGGFPPDCEPYRADLITDRAQPGEFRLSGPLNTSVRVNAYRPPFLRLCAVGRMERATPCVNHTQAYGETLGRYRVDRDGKYQISYMVAAYGAPATSTLSAGAYSWRVSVRVPSTGAELAAAWAMTLAPFLLQRIYQRTDDRGTKRMPLPVELRDSLVFTAPAGTVFDVVISGGAAGRASACVAINRVAPDPLNLNAKVVADPLPPVYVEVLPVTGATTLAEEETTAQNDLGLQVTVLTHLITARPAGVHDRSFWVRSVESALETVGSAVESVLAAPGRATPIHVPSVQEMDGTRYTLEPVSRESSATSGRIRVELGEITITSPRSPTANTANTDDRPYSNRLILTQPSDIQVNFSAHPLCPVEAANGGQAYPAQGGSGSVAATAPASCTYPIRSTASWITIGNGLSGSGNHIATFTVAPNPANTPRTAAVRVGGRIAHVVQAGANLAPDFGDVPPQHPFFSFVTLMKARGITQGCSSNPPLYCPDEPVTRGQMAAFLIRAIFAGHEFAYERTVPVFTDVPAAHPFFKYIQKLRELNVTLGCTDTEFCPDAHVTRGQMAAFIIRAVHGQTFPFTPQPYFTDVPAGHPYFTFVQKMKDFGFTSGCTAAEYCAASSITRAQMAAFIIRAFETPW